VELCFQRTLTTAAGLPWLQQQPQPVQMPRGSSGRPQQPCLYRGGGWMVWGHMSTVGQSGCCCRQHASGVVAMPGGFVQQCTAMLCGCGSVWILVVVNGLLVSQWPPCSRAHCEPDQSLRTAPVVLAVPWLLQQYTLPRVVCPCIRSLHERRWQLVCCQLHSCR